MADILNGSKIGGWTKYDGDREKEFYDVLLFDGTLREMCWPNADSFYPDDGSLPVKGSEAEFIRLSRQHPMDVRRANP